MKAITCRILTVGNEILNGKTIDTNSAFIARKLMELGIEVTCKVALPDDVRIIATAIKASKEDVLLLTGGLGPTPDDLTRDALAKAFREKLVRDEQQVKRLEGFFRKYKRPVVECNYLQALVPEGFSAVDNDYGTAPALFRKKPFIFALPGVPRELEGLMPDKVIPAIRKAFRCPPLYLEEIRTTGIGESMLYDRIKDLPFGPDILFASLPESSGVIIRLSGRDAKRVRSLASQIRSLCREFVYGGRDATLAGEIQKRFIARKRTLAVAESCTGGLIASALTAVQGSSAYFEGGVVSYSNNLKVRFLGVPERVLREKGAVSRETALCMARGIRLKTGADVGLSVTGIAGPSGGTPEKPVGTVFMAVSTAKGERAECRHFFGSRKNVQERSAAAALFMVLGS